MTILSKDNPLVFDSVTLLAKAVREKSISAVELAKHYIDQIEKVNPAINAIFQVNPERIVKDAQALDQQLAKGQLKGPLHGIPITIKDNLITKNIATTGGSFAFLDYVPEQDATVVQRLKTAGAIILGKTNLPDFALSWETESSAFGRTNNPHNIHHTAGGSSGGEAAILAAGGSALGIGTDSAGSIRLPAHYCGIAGLRPSRGLIPSTGHHPPKQGFPVLGVFAHLNTIGPMARYVSDLIYVLPLLMGKDDIDPYAQTELLKKEEHFSVKGLRVALYSSVNGVTVDPEIDSVLNQMAKTLENSGAIVTATIPPGLDEARGIYCDIVGADGGKGIRQLLTELNYPNIPTPLKKSLRLIKKRALLQPFLDAWIQWDFFKIRFLEFMKNYDVILCPAAAKTALSHHESLADAKHFTNEQYLTPYTLLGWPSVVFKAGISDQGLPIGVQIVANHRKDYLALQTALFLESQVLMK